MGSEDTHDRMRWKDFPRVARWAFRQVWAIDRARTLMVAVLTLSTAMVPAATTAILGKIVSLLGAVSAGPELDGGATVFWLGAAVAVLLLGAVTAAGGQYARNLVADQLGLATSSLLLRHAARLDLAFFENPESQDMLHRAARDPGGTCFRFVQQSADIVGALLQAASLVAILFFIAPGVTWVLVLAGLPSVVVQWRLARVAYRAEHERARARRWANYYAAQLVNAQHAASTRLLDLGPHFVERFEEVTRDSHAAQRRFYRLRLVAGGIAGLFFVAGFAVALAVLGGRVLNQQLDIGHFAAFWVAAWRLGATFRTLAADVSEELFAGLSILNLMQLLDRAPALVPGTKHPSSVEGAIEFREVGFSYPGSRRAVLRGVNLRVEAGETVALVGLNGAGKTTIGKLIARLYDPTEGSILIDGIDVRELSPAFLREHVALAMQQPERFEATAHQNLAYGNWRSWLDDRAAIERLVSETRLGTLVDDLPDGLDTRLGRAFGERDLSGGQWRQLGVARAVGRRTRILILDEPSAHLDTLAEAEQARGIASTANGRTTIVISHRMSTVMRADRIIVLDGGGIVEEGTHAELVARGGRYAALWDQHTGQLRAVPEPERAAVVGARRVRR